MSARRNIRLRREYLYRKSLEGKERETYERKERIKKAIAEGKQLPSELRDEERKLRAEIEYDDAGTAKPRSTVDDEYAEASIRDPKVCVTTSREPSSKLKQFAKEIRLMFPNSQRVNRGNHKTEEIVDACRKAGFTDIVMVQETRGEPDALIVSHLPYGPTAFFSLHNVVQRHDIEDRGTISEAYPHLIFHKFTTRLGERVSNIIKYCFPVPKPETKRVMTFANVDDFISFRHHTYRRSGPEIALTEVGPRFDMRCFRIRLGTIEQVDAEDEWVLRAYLNTAQKKALL